MSSNSSPKIASRLKLYFAMLSCLGGLVLTAGTETESIPVIAVFFAIFGYLFVDLLELFALPPIAAYAAMALAALYCVSDFTDLDSPGNHQMEAVARLLVFVQAILMLQRKSRRIFEQLGVFCLLELIVAAVFNNAISYGLLLIPIGIIGAWALCLLAALSASEGIESIDGLEANDETGGFFRRGKSTSQISTSAPESMESLASAALRLPRIAMLTLAPSVLLVGVIFFYALPRTTDAARARGTGNALIGFSDKLQLGQIGQMSQNAATAVRFQLKNRNTDRPYQAVGGIYLRGRALDQYRVLPDVRSAEWKDTMTEIVRPQRLPREFFPERATDENFYDSVTVEMTCESMRSTSLFAISPYYQVKHDAQVLHCGNSWTLARPKSDSWNYPRMDYSFGTHAFRNGIQSDLIAIWQAWEEQPESSDPSEAQIQFENYREDLLELDTDSLPSIESLAEFLAGASDSEKANQYKIAKRLESYLATSGDFQYTLNLNAEAVPGMDPVEQFISKDKKGHCQYFASSLALMLRSVDIPARVVVGYYTDEFNELDQHFVARQLHAHSWVEALIHRDDLGENRNIYGQPDSDYYWLRLDPTPSAGSLRESGGGVSQVLDLAQTMWDDYVVEMDNSRQDGALVGGGVTPMNGAYEQFVDWLGMKINRVRAGELGGGALAGRQLFSLPAAVLGVALTLLAVLLLRVRTPRWLRERFGGDESKRVAKPTITFYAETLDQLGRVGIARKASQTPQELAQSATTKLEHPLVPSVQAPLDLLTARFYQLRFGQTDRGDLEMQGPIEHARQRSPEIDSALNELKRSVDLLTINSKSVDQTT